MRPSPALRTMIVATLLGTSASTSAVASTAVPDATLETMLIRIGLDPEPLAAAGVSANEVATVVAAVAGSTEGQAGALASADATFVTKKASADALGRLVKSGQATAQEINDYQTALSELATAEASRAGVLDALFDAGVASLSEAEQDTLATIRSNRSLKAPTQFLVVDRTESDWLELKAALAHERIAAELGDTVDSEVATLLASARAQSDVADAKSNLDSTLSAVASAWDGAVNP